MRGVATPVAVALTLVVVAQPAQAQAYLDLPSGFGFGGLLFVALLWSLLPAMISASIASNRGQSGVAGFLIGLVLGWIGLILVYLLMKPEVLERARTTVDNVGRPRADVAEQIRKLGELRDQGLLTEDEFQAKKAELLARL